MKRLPVGLESVEDFEASLIEDSPGEGSLPAGGSSASPRASSPEPYNITIEPDEVTPGFSSSNGSPAGQTPNPGAVSTPDSLRTQSRQSSTQSPPGRTAEGDRAHGRTSQGRAAQGRTPQCGTLHGTSSSGSSSQSGLAGSSPQSSTPLSGSALNTGALDAASSSQAKWVGKRLAHFRLTQIMGAGTMGVVFQAQHVHLHRMTAVKVLRRRMIGAENEKMVERFLLEARTAASIDNPCIAQVYEINHHEGWWYIAMEFLGGGSLRQLLDASGPLKPKLAAAMMADAAHGLSAAHDVGAIHRDIKPANLMLTRRGRCKLVDFGIVKLDSAENPFHDDDNKIMGTPLYLAPEVILRKGASPASDVYGLGATMYALLTGEAPFTGKTVKDLMRNHIHAAIPDVRAKVPNCPDPVAELISASLAKDPADRPTAHEFTAILRTVAPSDEGSGTQLFQHSAGNSVGVTGGPECNPTGSITSSSSIITRQAIEAESGESMSGTMTQPLKTWWFWASLFALVVVCGGILYWRDRLTGSLGDVSNQSVAATVPDHTTPDRTVPDRTVPEQTARSSQAGQHQPAAADKKTAATPRAPSITNSIGMKLSMVPASTFTMGSPPTEPMRNNDERMVEVTLTKDFYMSATEVTQKQWAEVMGDDYVPPEGIHPNEASGLRFLGDTLPAYASWFEAAEFCRRLSEKEKRQYRLPTEAEWERACRAGTTTAYYTGSTLDESQAAIDGDFSKELGSGRRPLPVASFRPNALGLYDMHGNVMEWCQDWKAEYPIGPLTDPVGPADGVERVIRGGSWDSYARTARSANRWSNYPVLRTDYIGFRVVMVPDAQPRPQEPYIIERPNAVAKAGAGESEPVTLSDAESVDPALPDYVPQTIVSQRLRSVGSDTMDRLMLAWERRFQTWHEHVVIRHEGKGSGTATPALVEGFSHFGPMSRALKESEIREFQAEYGYAPTQVRVAIDALAVYVHPQNPVAKRGLTMAELDAIFSQTRKRGAPKAMEMWGGLGLQGPWRNAGIECYIRNPASGTYGVFKSAALLDGEFKTSCVELVGSAEIIAAIAGNPKGIGFSGIGYDQTSVSTVPLFVDDNRQGTPVAPAHDVANDGSYPLSRALYLTINRPPGQAMYPLQREFLRFVYSRQGQEIVAQAGFFPLSAKLAAQESTRLGLVD